VCCLRVLVHAPAVWMMQVQEETWEPEVPSKNRRG
jgi:hypothetical protein